MKKLLASLALAGSLVASGLIYPTTMVVDELDYQNDIVRLQTATGFVYEMEGTEDYIEGDMVSLIMFTNGTKYIMDDIILDARYAGWSIYQTK